MKNRYTKVCYLCNELINPSQGIVEPVTIDHTVVWGSWRTKHITCPEIKEEDESHT